MKVQPYWAWASGLSVKTSNSEGPMDLGQLALK